MTKLPAEGGALFLVLLFLAGPALAQTTEDTIHVGDLVFIEIYRHPELSTSTQVSPDGDVSLPYIGQVNLLGLTKSEASSRVSQALLQILKNPRVTVSRSVVGIATGARTAEMKTEVVPLHNANADTLREALQGMTSEGGSVSFEPGTNSLIITDTPSALQNIMSVVARLDQMESQLIQVRIEAKIADVQVNAFKEYGVRWLVQGAEPVGGYYPLPSQDVNIQALKGPSASPFANEQLNTVRNSNRLGTSWSRRFIDETDFDRRVQVPIQVPTPGQFFFGLLNKNIDIGVLVDALIADDRAELLANPYVITVNHQKAYIDRIEEFPYTEFGTEVTGRTTFTTRFLELGIKLAVTPHVHKDQGGPYVKLELEPEVSFPVGSSNGVPIRSVRSSRSVANVRNGQTLVIGGIFRSDERNVEQRVPGLGKLPVLGALFKRTEKAKIQTELMVFVTPTVYETPESITWDRMINLSDSLGASLPVPGTDPLQEARGE